MPNEFIIKNGYFSQGNSEITGSLTVTAGITGSVLSSSYALTASYALTSGGGGAFPFTGSAQITGSLIVDGTIRGKLNRYDYASYVIEGNAIRFDVWNNNPNNPLPDSPQIDENEPIYFYVDINDTTNNIEYRELSFDTITDINTFLLDEGIDNGRIVFYSYTNNTDNLRVGGSNVFSTIFGINKQGKSKILSNKKWFIDSNALPILSAYLTSSFMTDMSSSINNFSTEYLNQAQIETICTSSDNIGRLYFNKYEERHLSRFYYYGNYIGGTPYGVDEDGDLEPTTNKNKLLSTTLCGMIRIDDSTFNISTLKITTTSGVQGGLGGSKIKGNYDNSLFHVYIFVSTDYPDRKILAIEPLSIDSLTIPFPFRGIDEMGVGYKYKIKVGASLQNINFYRSNDDFADSIYFNLPSINDRNKYFDVIRLYENKTCDVFKRPARIVHVVYNRKNNSLHAHVYYCKLNK